MLSEDLDHLAAEFEQYARDGVEFSTTRSIALAARLHAMADQAKAMERTQVPAAGRLNERDLASGRIARLADRPAHAPRLRCVTGEKE